MTETSSETQLNKTEPCDSKKETVNINGQSPWIYCICVVTFDLELGQVIETIYPTTTRLTKQEISNICYLAFPDSNSGCMGDTQFTVRLRRSPANQCLPADFFWGYVYFRQVKDITLPRGYFQKSVMLLSTRSDILLLTDVCSALAEDYFARGTDTLKEAFKMIEHWPPPTTGSENFSLLLPKTVIHRNSVVDSTRTDDGLLVIASHIQILWELVLTCEPLVVFAANPTACSRTVLALVSMISPLIYSGDYRPYFTIHDNEFKEFTNAREPPAAILGVTNPFFAKTLKHWPHTIHLCEGIGTVVLKRGSSNAAGKGNSCNVRTTYRPFLKTDKSLARRLKLGRRPVEAHAALLRRHLLELTQSFMIPLERYMASLMPLQKNISPFKVSIHPLPFNQEKFLATLSSSGPQLTSKIKGDWDGLYRKFLRSYNFNVWFNTRHTELSQKLCSLQLEALSSMDLTQWVKNKVEVEIVDMVLNIRNKITKVSNNDTTIRDRLEQRLQELLSTLPDDLRHILQVAR